MFMVWNASDGCCVGLYTNYNDAKEDILTDSYIQENCYEIYKIKKIGEFIPTISLTFCED